jgi:lysophospholipase L1-like esterase
MKKSFRTFFTLKQRMERKIFRSLYSGNAASQLPIDSNSIILLGDSQTQFFEVRRYFKNRDIKNRGVSGERADQVFSRLNEVVDGKPKKIFIEIGVNDLLQGVSVDTTFQHIERIATKIKADSPATTIYLQNILPTREDLQFFSENGVRVLPLIKLLNEKIQHLCMEKNITYIDLFNSFYMDKGLNQQYDCGDGLHLNHKGYKKWTELISPYIAQ